jgi:hypothetical protein
MSATHEVTVRSRRTIISAAEARAVAAAWTCDPQILAAVFPDGGDVVSLTLVVTPLAADSVLTYEATEVARLLVHTHAGSVPLVARLPDLFEQDWTLTPAHACFAFVGQGAGELSVLLPAGLAPPARLGRWQAFAWPGRADACFQLFPPPAGAPACDVGVELHPHADGEDFAVVHAALSPDGALLATGGEHGTVAVWRTADLGEVVRLTDEFEEDGDPSPYVQLSRDGQTLAWTSLDGGGLRLRPVAGGATIRAPGEFYRYALCPDGRTLVAQVGAVDLTLLDLNTGDPLRPLAPGSGGEDRTEFTLSGDGELVAVATRGHQVQVLSLPNGEPLWSEPLPAADGPPPALALSRAGDRLAVARADGVITVHDARTGIIKHTLPTMREELGPAVTVVQSLDFSPDGDILAAAVCERYPLASYFHVYLIRVADNTILRKLGAPSQSIHRVEFAAGPLLLAQGYDKITLYRPFVATPAAATRSKVTAPR